MNRTAPSKDEKERSLDSIFNKCLYKTRYIQFMYVAPSAILLLLFGRFFFTLLSKEFLFAIINIIVCSTEPTVSTDAT